MKAKRIALLCTLPFFLCFFAFQIVPLIWIVINSFFYDADSTWGCGNYTEILTSGFYLQSITYSLELAFWSSFWGLLIALITSYSLFKIRFSRFHNIVMAFTNMTSNFVGVPLAFAFVILLGLNGCLTILLRNLGMVDILNLYAMNGMIIIYIYFQIPLGILLLYPALHTLKTEWQESAQLLGANVWHYWRLLVIPILTPALLGTFIILFANSLGAYATVYALSSGSFNVVPIRISSLVAGDVFLDPYMASALSVLLVILMVLITIINQWLLRRNYQNYKKE